MSKPNSKKERQFRFVRCDRIILPDPKQEADWNNVFSIQETIAIVGVVTPIIVRRVVEGDGPNRCKKIVLVAGRDRLEAAQLAGLKCIPCFFIKGDETYIRLAAVTENIWRKRFTALQRAEFVAEYYRLALEPANVSGHGCP
jgi:ParB/RepB/Spo0J family partition protein